MAKSLLAQLEATKEQVTVTEKRAAVVEEIATATRNEIATTNKRVEAMKKEAAEAVKKEVTEAISRDRASLEFDAEFHELAGDSFLKGLMYYKSKVVDLIPDKNLDRLTPNCST